MGLKFSLVFKWHLTTRLFANQITFDHSNTRLVWYLDTYCTPKPTMKYISMENFQLQFVGSFFNINWNKCDYLSNNWMSTNKQILQKEKIGSSLHWIISLSFCSFFVQWSMLRRIKAFYQWRHGKSKRFQLRTKVKYVG